MRFALNAPLLFVLIRGHLYSSAREHDETLPSVFKTASNSSDVMGSPIILNHSPLAVKNSSLQTTQSPHNHTPLSPRKYTPPVCQLPLPVRVFCASVLFVKAVGCLDFAVKKSPLPRILIKKREKTEKK
jgi:hypothetical protein